MNFILKLRLVSVGSTFHMIFIHSSETIFNLKFIYVSDILTPSPTEVIPKGKHNCSVLREIYKGNSLKTLH